MKKLLRTGLVLAAFGAVVASGIAPAQAATTAPAFPEGYALLALDCEDAYGQLWNIDPVTGDSTPIGTPSVSANNTDCAGQGTYDPISGTSYYVGWGDDTLLTTVDAETGLSTAGPVINDNDCVVTAGNDGTLYEFVSGPEFLALATLDPSTGLSTIIGTDIGTNFSSCAAANNPADDKIYSFHDNGDGYDIITIDKVTGLYNFERYVDTSALSHAFCADSMAVDVNGIAWVQDDCAPGYGIVAVDLSTGEAWDMAPGFFDVGHTVYPTAEEITNSDNAEGSFYQMSMWIVPTGDAAPAMPEAPALAQTGIATTEVAAFSGIAVLALIAGIGIIAVRRRKA